MSNKADDDSNENELAPLIFNEELGEHTLSMPIRKALVWASLQRFVAGSPAYTDIDEAEFDKAERSLAKAAVFHGPFTDYDKAMEEAKSLKAIVVTPICIWTDGDKPHYVVSLSN